MINEETLTEKFKYLIKSETTGEFTILEFAITFNYDKQSQDTLRDYIIDIKFDYENVINEFFNDFIKDIKKISYRLESLFHKYTITNSGKLKLNGNVYVAEPIIWEIDFLFEERHIFSMSFNVVSQDG